ncbi:MAG: hypothetical protein GY795_07620 [Desulfobacterales bacterium]|nr:hypothetical protein [Desulfobacterales bacterium]
MVLTDIKENIKTLSRSEKFHLIQFLVTELEQEEQNLSHYFEPGSLHGFWSQYDAFEAAGKLQMLLNNEDKA